MEQTALSERLMNTTAVIHERVEDALERVLDNIADPNTKPDAVREITLKMKIKPTSDRSAAQVEISCAPKLAVVAPFPTMLFFGKRGGKLTAFENNQQQTSLFNTVDPETGEALDGKTIAMPGRSVI